MQFITLWLFFQFLNPPVLNRTQVIWKDPQGVEHAQGWLYPLHEILEMVEDGRIKELKETTK